MLNNIGERDREMLERFMPKEKVGIRILDSAQLENVFPAYDTLIGKIDAHRKNIERISQEDLIKRDYQLDMMYDNVFSILGKRGSGKTSTLMTLRYIFKEKNENDLVLPLIIPDIIPKDGQIMGWLLSLLGDNIEYLEVQLEKYKVKPQDDDYFKDCKVKRDNSLRKKYEMVRDMYYSNKFRPDMLDSYYDVLGGTEIKEKNNYDFSKCLSQLWDEIINVIRKIQKFKNAETGAPLIFIMFDDVDLSPERTDELMSVIIKYLSHPNIIVITSADEELFVKIVENNFAKKLNYSSNATLQDMINDSIMKVFSENKKRKINYDSTAALYLDKVLPPSTRFFLNSFSRWTNKCEFQAESDNDYAKTIKDLMIKLVNDFYNNIGVIQAKNFLVYNGEFLNVYVSFFGETSRQIQNQWLIIKQFVKDVEKAINGRQNNNYKNKMYHIVCDFLHNSINANSELKKGNEDIENLVNHIFYWEYNGYNFYIDYNYINEKLQTESLHSVSSKSEILLQIKKAFALMMLCAFAENILLIIDTKAEGAVISDKRKRLHAGKTLENYSKWLCEDKYKLVKRNDKVEYMLWLYEEFWNEPERMFEFDINDSRKVRNILMSIHIKTNQISDMDESKFRKNVANIFANWERDMDVYGTYAKMIFMLYNDIYCIDTSLLYRTMYVKKIFDIPVFSTMILSGDYFDYVMGAVLDDVQRDGEKFFENLRVESVNDETEETKEKDLQENNNYYALSEMLQYVSVQTDDDKEKIKKNQMECFEYYKIINGDKLIESLNIIESYLSGLYIMNAGNAWKMLRNIRKNAVETEIISKKNVDNFYREMKKLQKVREDMDEEISDSVKMFCMSIDLAVSKERLTEAKECVRQIKINISRQKSQFGRNWQDNKKSNVLSYGFYINEVLGSNNAKNVDVWYDELNKRMKNNSELSEAVYTGIEKYINDKIIELDDMEK